LPPDALPPGDAQPDAVDPTDFGSCADAEGPMHPATLTSQVDALIVGKWLHCSGRDMLRTGEVGIEVLADHTYFALASDGSGGTVRKTGFGSQGTWSTDQTTATTVTFQWNTTTGFDLGHPSFEDHPRKMAMLIYQETVASIYVLVP
jgi:hypothetical protein